MNEKETDDYLSLLRNKTPIIDVRAPAEFQRGSLPTAVNLPILDDAEREQVGIAYKNLGKLAAITKGHELVNEHKKSERVGQWREFVEENSQSVLCCWRGGMRSELAQSWLGEQGIYIPRVIGGSKALRQYCLATLQESQSRRFVVVSGSTGSGKTNFLRALRPSIDLEGLANHRGSAFGGMTTPQPTPISFEFLLAMQLLQFDATDVLLIEDESTMIGRLQVPDPIFSAMCKSPIVVVHVPHHQRIELTYETYVVGTPDDSLRTNLSKIQKRLGQVRYQEILACLSSALESGDRSDHYRWIELLLKYYYDPMYKHQLTKKRDRIEFEGNMDEVRSYLGSNYGIR